MDLKDLEEIIDNMILQHDYPGYEARALRLALPSEYNNISATVYRQALRSENVHVRLAALRWFQSKSGLAKKYATAISSLLNDSDPWVKVEAIKTLDLGKVAESSVINELLQVMRDPDAMVRVEAAKALGNLNKEIAKQFSSKNKAKNSSTENESVYAQTISALQEATEDENIDVRRKAIKSLRKLGAFSTT